VLESLNLGALLRETVDAYPHSSDLMVNYEIEADLPMIRVDRQQVVSMIENLVSNSVKAMKGKGTLGVRLRRAQELPLKGESRDVLELIIEDTGCGIPAHELPRVFEPYFSHSKGGTGLGLAIVKKIVEDHHGNIQLESEPGSGTRVRVRLPLSAGEADV
jgi:signal transduction histidine kinase